MLRREIKYEDLTTGEMTSDIFYFNLNKTEIVELEVELEGGLSAFLERIIETKDRKKIVEQMKRLILLCYGVKSEDGKRFIKNDQVREEFTQHPAFDALFIEMATNEEAAAEFLKGVLPRDMAGSVDEAAKRLISSDDKATEAPATPPTPPTPPTT